MTGDMCGKDFKKILKITKHIKKKSMNVFWFPGKDINISNIFYKKQNIILLAYFPVVPLTR